MTARPVEGEFRTLPEVLRAAARVNPDVEAYVEPAVPAAPGPDGDRSGDRSGAGTPRRSITFAAWDAAADGVAGLLAAHGVGRGSVVCLVLTPSIDYAVAYAAAARLGAITSGVNLRLGADEVRSILERTRPAVTVLDDGAPVPSGAVGRVLRRLDLVGAATGPPPGEWPDLDPSDPVAVVWTSGTTGLPKGAVFDHANLAAVAAGTDVLSHPGDRRLSPLPFAHVGSMTRPWDELVHGVTTVITPTTWRAADAIRIMATERITVAQGVPTQWALVLAHPDLAGADLAALRVAGTGASRMPAEQVAALRERLGVPVVVRYTSTEASLGTGTVPGDPDGVVATTVGRPVPGVSLRVTADNGTDVGTGEVGRVRLRSGAVMRGYWAGPPATPGGPVRIDTVATGEVLSPDGWLTTGDVGRLDAGGNLTLVGRATEMYIRGGYNVYPAEVEAALADYPGLAQVAVVGAPDPVLGEIGVAFAVPRDGADPGPTDELLHGLRARATETLADYKAPDRVVVVVDALPLTAMLKVDKRALAPEAARAAASRGHEEKRGDHDQ